MQISYPTLSLDEIRQLLKWVKVKDGGKYDYFDFQVAVQRFSENYYQRSSVYQTLTVITTILKQKNLQPETLLKINFNEKSK